MKRVIVVLMDSPKKSKCILFDMDGVLVDESKSYRAAIKSTAEHFAKRQITTQEVEAVKMTSGFNNDWEATKEVLKRAGIEIEMDKVIEKFQEYYLGKGDAKGFIENEEWLIENELLEKLSEKYVLGIMTGRPIEEAIIPLRKNSAEKYFQIIIGMEDCEGKGKPDPFGLNLAMQKLGIEKENCICYIGDSIDDVKAAVNAGIPAIGCMPAGVIKEGLANRMLSLGAKKVFRKASQAVKVLL